MNTVTKSPSKDKFILKILAHHHYPFQRTGVLKHKNNSQSQFRRNKSDDPQTYHILNFSSIFHYFHENENCSQNYVKSVVI